MGELVLYALLLLAGLLVAGAVLFWAVRRLVWGYKARKFILEANDVHGFTYTQPTVSQRERARERLLKMIEEAAGSKNIYINNADVGETLKGYVEFAVKMSTEGRAVDAVDARSWGEEAKRKLAPMLQRPGIGDKGKQLPAG